MLELNSIAMRSQALSQTSLFGGPKPSTTMSDIILANSIINKVKSGQKMYDAASQNLTTQNAWGEVATTNNGSIYVYKDGHVTTITPDEYIKAEGEYQYLTNSDLMGIRRESAPYQDRWTENMAGTIGMDTIEKQLISVVKDFDSITRNEYVQRTGNNISQSAWKGMQLLIGDGPDGYYKVKTKTEVDDINAAVKYLWDILGINGQAKLKAEIAIRGGNPNKAEDRYGLIMDVLSMHTGFEQDPSFEKGATEYDPDGDALGSAIGMAAYLHNRGKKASIILPDRWPATLDFILDGFNKENIIIFESETTRAKEILTKCDLIICQDLNSFTRTEMMQEVLRTTKCSKVLIDHHQNPERQDFDLVFSEINISSASELVFYILMAMEDICSDPIKLPRIAGRALLTGMTTDTNNFGNSTFPSTFNMAASLIEAGYDK
mgnify:CR=1 FL=1